MNIQAHKSIVVMLACILAGCSASKKAVTIEWPAQQIVIDGKLDEWQPIKYYHSGTHLKYSINNDREQLYICIVAPDQKTQQKIAMAGFQITLDTLGGRKKHVTIQYPLTIEKPPPLKPGDRGNSSELARVILKQANTMMISGFQVAKTAKEIPLQNSLGIKIALDWTADGSLVYEAAIPFKTFMKFEGDKIVGMQFTVKGLAQVSSSGMQGGGMPANMPPPSGGGGGMPPGGFGSPGGSPPGGSAASDMFEDKTLKVVIRLADKR